MCMHTPKCDDDDDCTKDTCDMDDGTCTNTNTCSPPEKKYYKGGNNKMYV